MYVKSHVLHPRSVRNQLYADGMRRRLGWIRLSKNFGVLPMVTFLASRLFAWGSKSSLGAVGVTMVHVSQLYLGFA